jgi:hypothetical protein
MIELKPYDPNAPKAPLHRFVHAGEAYSVWYLLDIPVGTPRSYYRQTVEDAMEQVSVPYNCSKHT